MITCVKTRSACPFCGTTRLAVLVPADALGADQVDVVKCTSCDIVFLREGVLPNRMRQQETAYWDNEDQSKIYFEERVQGTFVKEFESRLARLEKYVAKTGKLLDVGCGVGHFLAAARKHGWTVQGLDISSAAQSAARERYHLEVQVGTIESGTSGHSALMGPFDAITLWDVLEHIRRPIESLVAANHLLRSGGILAIKTPNEEGLFKQLALTLYRWLGPRCAFLLKYVYYIPHYFSYTKGSLTRLLERSGFEGVHWELDETPLDFAEEKINVHYQDDPKRSLVVAALPVANLLGRILRKSNKMVVYARKIRDAATHS